MHPQPNRTVDFVLARAVLGGVLGFALGWAVYEASPDVAWGLPPAIGPTLGSIVAVASRRPRLAGFERSVRIASPLLGAVGGLLVGVLLLAIIGPNLPDRTERIMPGETSGQAAYIESLHRFVSVFLLANVALGAIVVTWCSWRAVTRVGASDPHPPTEDP